MIDRGLIPSPNADPIRLDAVGRSARFDDETRGVRFRTAGVLMIGLGLGLTVLITFTAGRFDIGMGVGGAWAVLGGASLLNYFLMRGPEDAYPRWTARGTDSSRGPDGPPGPDAPSSR